MLCLDPSLTNPAPWSPGYYTAAIVLSPGRFALAVVRHRRDEIPTAVLASGAPYADPLTIPSRIYGAASRYDFRAVHVRAEDAHAVTLPSLVRAVVADAPPPAVRVHAPPIDTLDGALVLAVEIAAAVAPKRAPAPRLESRHPPAGLSDEQIAEWWAARHERIERARQWRRVVSALLSS